MSREYRRLVLFAVFFVTMCAFTWHNLAPSGHLEMTYDFQQYHPRISRLFPEGRIVQDAVDGEVVSRVVAEPVYVTVRLPRGMETMSLKLLHRGNVENAQIGLQQGGSNSWHYELRPIGKPGMEDGWHLSTHDFSLKHAAVTDGSIRVIIAAPGLQPEQQLELGKIEVTFVGQRLTPGHLWQKLRARL